MSLVVDGGMSYDRRVMGLKTYSTQVGNAVVNVNGPCKHVAFGGFLVLSIEG